MGNAAYPWQLGKYTVTVPGLGNLGRAGLTDANKVTVLCKGQHQRLARGLEDHF